MKRLCRYFCTLLLLTASLSGLAIQAGAQGGPLVIVPREADPEQRISFSFQQADIDDVLRFLADASGKLVFKDASVSTTLTIRNRSRITVNDAINLVQTVLSLRGFALVVTDDALIVTTQPEARARRSTKVSVGKEDADIPTGKEIVTHIFPLENIDAVRLRDELRPIFQGGSVELLANSDTNSLIVVDEGDNIRRIGQLVRQLDRGADAVTIEVIPLKFADALEVSRYLEDLFRPEQTNQQNQQQSQQPRPGGAPAPAAPGQSNLAALRGRVRFTADERANALIVYASPANIKLVREILDKIDVDLAPRTEFRVVELEYADAGAVAEQVNQLIDPNATPGRPSFFSNRPTSNDPRGLQDFRVVAEPRTNRIILTAPVENVTMLEGLIRELDRPSAVENVVRVFQLKNAIASEAANTLRNLFMGTTGQGGFGFSLFGGGLRGQIPPGSPLDLLRQVTIVPNDQTNQLLISGPAQTFQVIESLLSEDEGLDRRLPQVFIEVIIADITLDDETRFGIEWNAVAGSSSFSQNFGLNDPLADDTGFKYSVVSKNFQATLRALKAQNKVRVVSTPHVMVTDNSPAIITIGERVPYPGQTTISNGVAQTSVEFEDVAITLNVTPHISPGDNILLDIDQVVNSLIEFIQIAPGQLAPRVTNRRAGTTVVIENNQTVVLGGIISDDEKRQRQKVPILGDIPLLGNLFRSTTTSKTRTELVVFLTPRIVREPEQSDAVLDYERSRLRVDPLKRLDAPFAKPLDINPEKLRLQRAPAAGAP